MSWTAWRSTSTDPQSVWPLAELLLKNLETSTDRQIVWSQTELHVHTVHVLYNWETSTDPQRVCPQTELQVQRVHALESLEVHIHKLSERLAPDRASSSDGPCLLQLGDTHRPSEGLAPDRASSSDGPCLGQPGGLHPQTIRAFGPWQRASRPPTTWD